MSTTIETMVLNAVQAIETENTSLNQEDYTIIRDAVQCRDFEKRRMAERLAQLLQARVMASRYKSLFSC